MLNDVKKNPHHYIEHLEYRNKTRKLKEAEHIKNHGHIIQRESNFHLFFNGANESRIKNSKKQPDLESSKSPGERKPWGNHHRAVYRKRWDNPETPFILKDHKDSYEALEPVQKSKADLERPEPTRSTFKVAGNNLIRPDSNNDYLALAQRIESLNADKKTHILRVLEQLESLAEFN